MADTTQFTGTQQAQPGTGIIPQAGQFLSNVQQIANQPSVQRSMPAVIAVVVLALGKFILSLHTKTKIFLLHILITQKV